VPNRSRNERIGRLLQMHASDRSEIKEVRAGDIAAAVGLKDVTTGDTLCDTDKVIILEKMEFPDPVISVAVEPRTKVDQEKMGVALQRLAKERSLVSRAHGPGVGSDDHLRHGRVAPGNHRRPDEARIQGRGERRQAAGRLSANAACDGGIGRQFVRQSGGRGQYGHVWLKLEPLPAGKGYEFVNGIVGGAVPREFVPAVDKGIQEAVQTGVIAGYPISMSKSRYSMAPTMTSIRTKWRSRSPVRWDSGGFRKAKPVLLEPIMRVEVVTPEDYYGDIVGDLNRRRGQIVGMEESPSGKVVTAEVPLAEMFQYSTAMRSMSQGRANYTMEFSKYMEVPTNVADAVMKKAS